MRPHNPTVRQSIPGGPQGRLGKPAKPVVLRSAARARLTKPRWRRRSLRSRCNALSRLVTCGGLLAPKVGFACNESGLHLGVARVLGKHDILARAIDEVGART